MWMLVFAAAVCVLFVWLRRQNRVAIRAVYRGRPDFSYAELQHKVDEALSDPSEESRAA